MCHRIETVVAFLCKNKFIHITGRQKTRVEIHKNYSTHRYVIQPCELRKEATAANTFSFYICVELITESKVRSVRLVGDHQMQSHTRRIGNFRGYHMVFSPTVSTLHRATMSALFGVIRLLQKHYKNYPRW
jgi:hypothetical protein